MKILLQIKLAQNKEAVSNITTVEKKKKIQTNYRDLASSKYISPTIQIFCCKIKVAEKIK